MPGPCLRSAACRCDDCQAAMGLFSAKDLVAVSSSSVFADEAEAEAPKPSSSASPSTTEEVVPAKPSETVPQKESEPAEDQQVEQEQESQVLSERVTPVVREAIQVADEVEENFDGLSAAELVQHSNWKARKVGFPLLEQAILAGEETSLSLFDLCVNESSMGALDGALDCARAFVQKLYNGEEESFISDTVPKLFKKALVGRPVTRDRGIELLLDMMEVNAKCMETTLVSLENGLKKERNPKVGTACVTACRAAVAAFGAMKLPMKNLQNIVTAALDVKNPAIRKEGTLLATDVDAWFQGAFKDILAGVPMSDATKKTLISAMESAKPPTDPLVPTRRFRGESETSGDNATSAVGQGKVDLFDVLPEKSVLDQLDGIKFDKRLQEQKWIERKNAVEEVISLCGTPPKLAQGDYSDLVRTLKGIIQNDSNQAVVIACIQLLGTLGAGLRIHFHQLARSCVSMLLQKYRDKKMPLINAVDSTLANFAQYCFNITEEKVVSAIDENMSSSGDHGKQKSTPLQRTNICQWLAKCLTNGWAWGINKQPALDFQGFVQLMQMVVDGTTDADPKVRDVSTACLAALSNADSQQGEAVPSECQDHIQQLVEDTLRKNPKLKPKFKAAAAKANKDPIPTSAPAPKPPASKKVPTSSASTAGDGTSIEVPLDSRPSGPAVKKKPTLSSRMEKKTSSTGQPARKTGPKSAMSAGTSAAVVDDEDDGPQEPPMDEETATEMVCSTLDVPDLQEALTAYEEATKWQDKTQVFECLEKYVTSQDSFETEHGKAIVSFVKFKTKDFKEANFNIMNAAWQVIMHVIQSCESPPFPRAYASMMMDPLVKKLGDKKQGQPVVDILLALCEACGPKYVTSRVMRLSAKVTSPKQLEDTMAFLMQVAEEFGATALNLKAVVDFCASDKGLAARQVPCKKKATECLTELYKQVGEPIRQLLDDAAAAQVSESFDKAGFQGPAKDPKRKVKGDAPEAAAAEGGAGLSLNDLIPRVDVSHLFTSTLLEQLGDESSKTAWKVRMKAIDDISDILHGAKLRIELTKQVKVTTAELRKRLNDTNRNLVAKALAVLGLMGASVGGDGVVSLAKGSAGPILACVGDSKKTVVLAVDKAIEQWTVHDGSVHKGAFLAIIQQASAVLSDAKVDRKVVLQWFVKNFPFDDSDRSSDEIIEAIQELGRPLISCLQDREPTTRKLGGQAVTTIVRFLGHDDGASLFSTSSRDLKPAVLRGVSALLKQAYDEVGNAPPASQEPQKQQPPNGVPESTTTKTSSRSFKEKSSSVSTASVSSKTSSRGPSSRASHLGATGKGPSASSTTGMRKPMAALNIGPDAQNNTDASLKEPVSPRTARGGASNSQSGGSQSGGDEALFKSVPPTLREKREEKGRKKRWPAMFDEKDKRRMEEYQQSLKEDMAKVVSSDLLGMMFKDADGGRGSRGSALDPAFNTLIQEVPNYGMEALEAFDLLLKWSTLQLLNNNSTVTNNVLQLLEVMFELASFSNYSMSDYEASAFLPHILSKLGEKQKRFRDAVREVMRLVCQVYPYSKYVPYVFNEIAPGQRSAYVLAECLDELARLARIHGTSILRVKLGVGNNMLKSIVSYVGDSRKEIRNNAVLFMEQIWEHCNRDADAFFKLVAQHKTNIPDKAKTLISNHFQAAAQKDPLPLGAEPAEVEGNGKTAARTLRLNHPKSKAVSRIPVPSSSASAAASSPPQSQQRSGKALAPATPEPRTPLGGSRLKAPSTSKKSISGLPGADFLDLDLPTTPPSPSERKRAQEKNSVTKTTPQEKENDPNTELLSHAMYQAGMEDSFRNRTSSTSSAKSFGATPMKFMRMLQSLEDDLKDYRDLMLHETTENPAVARERGIKALALLGSKEPPSGWVEAGFGKQAEWIDLIAQSISVPNVISLILDMYSSAVIEESPLPPLTDAQSLEKARAENRLLKLLLPATLTICWWKELRSAAVEDSSVSFRWISCFCDLVSRLMHKDLTAETGDVDVEEAFEIRSERSQLLKMAQTVLAKLCETPLWLAGMLARLRKCNENCREYRASDMTTLYQDELRLKRVLRSSLNEFVILQDSMVTPFHIVGMKETAKALDDLLSVGIASTDQDAKEDRACVERIVRALLVSDGKRFTEHVPPHDPSLGHRQSLRVVVAQILEDGNQREVFETNSPRTPERDNSEVLRASSSSSSLPSGPSATTSSQSQLTKDDEVKLSQIFGRISDAINAANKSERDQALLDLHEFDDSHPGFDAKAYLGSTSAWFQKYILDELSKRRAVTSEASHTSVNVASIRERIGKLRNNYVKKSEALSPAKIPSRGTSPVREYESSSSPARVVESDPLSNLSVNSPIKAATDKAMAVANSTSLESIRERMAARRKNMMLKTQQSDPSS